MSPQPFKQAVAALLFACGIALNPVSALAATTSIDFSAGLPAGGTDSGGTVIVDGYKFASTVKEGLIGIYRGVDFGSGLTVVNYLTDFTKPFTVSRVDGKTFDLQGLTSFAGNTLSGGPTEFELTPFDLNGNELQPVQFSAGQYWTAYTKTGTTSGQDVFTGSGGGYYGTVQGSFSNLSKLSIKFGGTDHFTAFSFSSATAPVPEPETYAMMLVGLALLGVKARRRNSKLG